MTDQKSEAYLSDWQRRHQSAEDLVPIIGRLYRDDFHLWFHGFQFVLTFCLVCVLMTLSQCADVCQTFFRFCCWFSDALLVCVLAFFSTWPDAS